MANKYFSSTYLIPIFVFLAACGTTYELPDLDASTTARAANIFEEERVLAGSRRNLTRSASSAANQYRRVVKRVEPVAEAFCRTQTASKDAFNCDVQIFVDNRTPERNAYQTYLNDGSPIIAITLPLIADARNEDELAFVLGHEFGHHIAEHIKKQEQQAIAGAIVMGALTAYSQANSGYYGYDSYAAQQQMEQNIQLGMQVGQKAYSQSYELESDVIGAYIAAAAGYDPIVGARYFARPEASRSQSGQLSFWGTHPPDEKRLATVIATMDRIKSSRSISEAE